MCQILKLTQLQLKFTTAHFCPLIILTSLFCNKPHVYSNAHVNAVAEDEKASHQTVVYELTLKTTYETKTLYSYTQDDNVKQSFRTTIWDNLEDKQIVASTEQKRPDLKR